MDSTVHREKATVAIARFDEGREWTPQPPLMTLFKTNQTSPIKQIQQKKVCTYISYFDL